ncbi:MAG: sigma-70 family RNA polymerase sigma factor, partial [Spirochaetaceae bacterium]|nr:sigma-70 family RNA polymerase sigma factor [Spirochaetaceae bacterium]
MSVSESVVLGARLGGSAEFAEIVRAYERRLYSFALASTRDRDEAEEAVQEIFLKVLVGIRDLRTAARFESWLFAVARNELSTRAKGRAARPTPGLDPDELGAEEAYPARYRDGARSRSELELGELYALLGRDEALAVALKYGGGFSVKEIALACGIAESTAKSRLGEARKRMRAAAARGVGSARDYGLEGFRIPFGLEERIMDDIATLKLGAFVAERMANADQMRLASLSLRGEAFDEAILAAMGRIEGGAELVRRTASRLCVKELASILNYVDRATEKRIIQGLETVDPEASEALKKNMFVFEDFILFDEDSLALLVDELGEEFFAVGLAACDPKNREKLLDRLGKAREEKL